MKHSFTAVICGVVFLAAVLPCIATEGNDTSRFRVSINGDVHQPTSRWPIAVNAVHQS